MREALGEVKALMEGSGESGEGISWEERCMGLHRHHQALAREYKRIEKRLVECQRKQLEVCSRVVMHKSCDHHVIWHRLHSTVM